MLEIEKRLIFPTSLIIGEPQNLKLIYMQRTVARFLARITSLCYRLFRIFLLVKEANNSF